MKKRLKAFQNSVAIFKINSINSVLFKCSSSRIRCRSLLILCAMIVVFSIRIL